MKTAAQENLFAIGNPMVIIFLSNLIVLFVGAGLFPLLPVFASSFDVSATWIGFYFAIIYIANAAGSMITGWLADRITMRSLFIALSVMGLPALLLLSFAQAFWQAITLTAILWFSGGAIITLNNIFLSLNSAGKNMGKSFSLLSLSVPLGSLIGGTVTGGLVGWAGFDAMFLVLGIIWVLLPGIGLFILQTNITSLRKSNQKVFTQERTGLGRDFSILILVTLLTSIAISTSRLSTPIMMQSQKFSPPIIASTATISGLLTIPAILLVGSVSAKVGTRLTLVFTGLLAAGGSLLLIIADTTWQFWLVTTFLLTAFSLSSALSSAMAAETLPSESLNRGMSWIRSIIGIGSIVSFASTGFLLDRLEVWIVFSGVALLAVITAAVLWLFPFKSMLAAPEPDLEERALLHRMAHVFRYQHGHSQTEAPTFECNM